MTKYISMGTGFHGMNVVETGNTPEKALYNYVKNWGHDPLFIFTTIELETGQARIKVAIKRLKEMGMI